MSKCTRGYVVVSVSHETSRGMTSGCSVSCCRIPQMLRVMRISCLTISRWTFLERETETAPDADSPSTVIDRCRSMGAKLSVLPWTGETDPQRFERVTLDTTPASLVIIGSQLVVRRRRHAARLRAVVARFKRARRAQRHTPHPKGATVKNGVVTCQSWGCCHWFF